jgi:hypothetical protein
MTIEKLKAEHPAVYAAIVAEVTANAEKKGVEAERERVKAWLAYAQIDAVSVAKGISEGTQVTPSVMAEMQVKAFSKNGLANIKADSAGTTATPDNASPAAPQAASEKQKETDAFMKDVLALCGVKPKAEAAKVVA